MKSSIFFEISNIIGFDNLIRNTPIEILKLNKITCTTKNNESYTIVRYNRKFITEDVVGTIGLLKSLILNDNLEAIGYSPPKAYVYNTFLTLNPEKTQDIVAEEFIDGAMINVFWNPKINLAGGWEISTRNSAGAEIFVQSANTKKTYFTLFKETLVHINLNINDLNKSYCYSFVMQHPSIPSISKYKTIELYLIEIYEIIQTANGKIRIFQIDRSEVSCFLKNTSVKFPKIDNDWENYDDLKNKYASITTPFQCKGVILRNCINGQRSKICNPAHNFAKQMKCIGKKELYKYLFLRHSGKVGEFLKLNPEYKKNFGVFRMYVHEFTNELHKNYIKCFIEKKGAENAIEVFRSHLNNLHYMYLTKLRLEKECVNNTVVKKYVNELKPELLFFCLDKLIFKVKTSF